MRDSGIDAPAGPGGASRELAAAIAVAPAPEALPALAQAARRHGFALLEDEVPAPRVTRAVTELNDLLTRRALDLHLRESPLRGVRLAWLSFGSAGRYEQTLYTDQDNALIFPDDADAAALRAALLPLARAVNLTLDRCGLRLCRGDVMAGNPRWCLSLGEWRATFDGWIEAADPQALLQASIFFDFRASWGDAGLSDELRGWLHGRVRRRPLFLRLLTANALQSHPPLWFFDRFRLRRGPHGRYFNGKLNAVGLFTDAARVLALARGVPATSTVERLRGWAQQPSERQEAESWTRAFSMLQVFRMRRQLDCERAGRPLDNDIYPAALGAFDRSLLRACLREAAALQTALALQHGH